MQALKPPPPRAVSFAVRCSSAQFRDGFRAVARHDRGWLDLIFSYISALSDPVGHAVEDHGNPTLDGFATIRTRHSPLHHSGRRFGLCRHPGPNLTVRYGAKDV